MTALPDWHTVSDAELACAAAAGDRGAFGAIYDRYADRLHDFCIGMLRDREAAADCVQEVFCTVADHLPELKDPDKLRPWLYAIARNEALRHIRQRGREYVIDEVPEAVSPDPSPDTLAARTELADLIAEAAGGLSDRDRAVLELSYRHGLDGPELAQALGVSHAAAKKMTQRLRDTIERSLGALLVARRVRKTNGCAELHAVLDGWDSRFTVLMRKRIARHIESCPVCDEERGRLVSPAALLGAAPVFVPAPEWLRERTLSQIELTAASGAIAGAPGSGSTRRVLLAAGVLAAIVIAALGTTILWRSQHNAPMTPANLTETTPSVTFAPTVTADAPTMSPPPAPPAERSTTSTAPPATQSALVTPPTTAEVVPTRPADGPASTTQAPPSYSPVTPTTQIVKPTPTPTKTSAAPTTTKAPNPILTQTPKAPITKKPTTTNPVVVE